MLMFSLWICVCFPNIKTPKDTAVCVPSHYLIPSSPFLTTFSLTTTLTFSLFLNGVNLPRSPPQPQPFLSSVIHIWSWVPIPLKIDYFSAQSRPFTIDKTAALNSGDGSAFEKEKKIVISIKIKMFTQQCSTCRFLLFCFRAVVGNGDV